MGYAILRVQKLKAAVAVQRSAKHNYREQTTPNADPDRTHDNTHHGPQNVAELMDAFNARLPDKHRKDAVQCIEVLVTGSPEAINAKDRAGQDAYFGDALAWLRKTFGTENVIGASIHRDESTAHMAAFVVPVDPESGRLNAKRWLGGSKALSELQTEFWQGVGRTHGLERGVERSRAHHKTIRQHYAEIEAAQRLAVEQGTITSTDLKPRKSKGDGLLGAIGLAPMVETPEGIARRLTDQVRPIVVNADQVNRENQRLKADVSALRRHVDAMGAQVKALGQLLAGLSKEQVAKLVLFANEFRRENIRTTERERSNERGREGRGR